MAGHVDARPVRAHRDRGRVAVGRGLTGLYPQLFGGSVLAAAIAVALAGITGMRRLRKLVFGRSLLVVQLDGSQYTDAAEPGRSDYTNVVHLDRSEYTEVRDSSRPIWMTGAS